ncbi:hypothetical protein DSM104299_04437 [Baekduia alba]|uniref:hypothetical protein n=1 Tax=Baekduia alba TaxID=2997333 RepID=UPI002340DE1A|nr:hypothetical protein [Baekduia alba]WCB95688.1 hypothetical protein DSM104299_04437 [Baekduia alba]
MSDARSAIEFALGENSWASLDRDALRLEAWHRNSASFGESLAAQTWTAVQYAAKSTSQILSVSDGVDRRLYPNADGGPHNADRTELESTAEALETALLLLERPSGWSDRAEYVRLKRELEQKYP